MALKREVWFAADGTMFDFEDDAVKHDEKFKVIREVDQFIDNACHLVSGRGRAVIRYWIYRWLNFRGEPNVPTLDSLDDDDAYI